MSRLLSILGKLAPIATAVVIIGLFGARPVFAAGTVGNGTPGSCTEAAFDTALSSGGKIKFNCGANPLTIQLTNTKTIALNTTINGGGLITLTDASHYPFEVNSSVTFKLQNLKIINSHGNFAGALRSYGKVSINNVTFQNNRADSVGGAISNYGTLKLQDVSFISNQAPDGGGALYNDGGTVVMLYGLFRNNHSLGGSSGQGGAFNNHAGNAQIYTTLFDRNQGHDGGAIYNNSGASFFTYYSDFTNNQAGYGGAVENNGEGEVIIATLKQNQAVSDGGAVWSLGGTFDIAFASLDQNSAGTTGGAVSVYGGSMTIGLASLTHNHAGQSGGAIYSTGDLDLENDTLSTNNTPTSGGGLYHSLGSLTSYFVTIANNTASLGGGGIYGDGSYTSDIQDTVLDNNGTNCAGTVPSDDYNFSSDNTCTGFNKTNDTNNADPHLLPLANNGGMGQTHLPQPASPLLNSGVSVSDVKVDERIIARPQSSNPDIGALETCPSKPDRPVLQSPGNGSTVAPAHIALNWDLTSCAAFYKVTVRRGSKTGTPVVTNNYQPFYAYLVGSLPKNITYYWRVTACNEQGCSNSAWWHFTAGKGPASVPGFPPFPFKSVLIPH